MSSQTPAASKNSANSNEKTNDVVSYGCSSPSAVESSSESKETIQNKEFLGNIDLEYQPYETDSGFLSGPLSSNLDESDDPKYSSADSKTNNFNKSNIEKRTERSQSHDKAADELSIFDSGCIEEEEEYVESNKAESHTEGQTFAQQHTHSHQQQIEQHSTKTSHGDEMRLKHDVDGHIGERFCNLSLEGEPINNLNSLGRVATDEPAGAAAAAATTTINTSKSYQTPTWEQYYQQNDDGDTYLHLACISGQGNIVAALIRLAIHPYLINIKNDDGQTALHLAALTKQPKILRMLLLAGAEPNLRDCHGNTPLHIACMSGDEQCVSALTMPFSASEINEGHRQFGYRPSSKLPNNLEIRNYDGEFCVHLAAESGHLKILQILVQYGADINAREGKGGYTPLHISIERSNEELFKFLIDDCKQKLNLEATTFGRLTAYQFACILKRTQMQSVLEKHGVEPLTPPDSEYESSDDDSE